MSSKKRNALIMLIIVAVLAVAIIISLIVLILQRTGLDSISISPEFTDTQLDINGDYKISIKPEPAGADISKFKYEIDSSSATFTVFDDNSAILHTSSEGAVTIYVTKGKVESNALTFEIVDKAAQEAAKRAAEEALAAEQAAAEAARAAEEAAAAEAAAANAAHVKVIKDSVNVRGGASTDAEALGKAKKGDTFEVIEDDGSWTKIKFGDKEGYIRNDLIEKVTESGAEGEEQPKDEAKKEEKKQEAAAETNQQQPAENTQQQEQQQQQPAQPTGDLQQVSEEATAQLLAGNVPPAGQTAEAAPAPVVAGPVAVWRDKSGVPYSQQEVDRYKAYWGHLEGGWEEWANHHTTGDLKNISNLEVDPAYICPY